VASTTSCPALPTRVVSALSYIWRNFKRRRYSVSNPLLYRDASVKTEGGERIQIIPMSWITDKTNIAIIDGRDKMDMATEISHKVPQCHCKGSVAQRSRQPIDGFCLARPAATHTSRPKMSWRLGRVGDDSRWFARHADVCTRGIQLSFCVHLNIYSQNQHAEKVGSYSTVFPPPSRAAS
jgi:hypothetical protein